MKTYDLLLILKPAAEADNSDAIIKKVENQIQSLKGKVTKIDRMGRKRLGYEIDRSKDGIMASLVMELEPSALEDLNRFCKLEEDIMRSMVTMFTGATIVDAPPPRRPGGRERPGGFGGGDRPSFGGDRPQFGDRPPRQFGDRPQFNDRPQGDRPERPPAERPA